MKDFEFMEEEFETVVLELDDGTDAEFAIVDEIEVEGEEYKLLSMILDDDTISEDPDDMIFMRDDTKKENCDEDEIVLTMIASDEEYERVVDAYTEEA